VSVFRNAMLLIDDLLSWWSCKDYFQDFVADY